MTVFSNTQLRLLVSGVLFVVLGPVAENAAQGADPVIHAAWNEPGDRPARNIDYFIKTDPPASPDFPDVELVTGSLTWQIWSTDTDNPDDIGDIGIITSPAPENFVVTIEDDLGNPGARHVKGIILDPTDAANQSGISGGRITGDLTGDLLVQEDSSGTGGDVDFAIEGTATGNITIPTVVNFGIAHISGTVNVGLVTGYLAAGDVSGSIVVTDRIKVGGSLVVNGNFTSTGSITIADIESPPDSTFMLEFANNGELGTFEFAGDLILQTGLKENVYMWSGSTLTSEGSIDLNNQGIAGFLDLPAGGSGSIINGGVVSGIVWLAAEGNVFSGTATFSKINGLVRTELGSVSGTINVTHGMTGGIIGIVGGNLEPSGAINIGGNLAGAIDISNIPPYGGGNLAGTVEVLGTLSGGIRADEHISGTITVYDGASGTILSDDDNDGVGDITGDVTVTGFGTFDGDICGANLSPGEDPLPPNIVVSFGPLGTICGITQGCSVAAPVDADPTGIDKNRFISFSNPNTNETAIRVTLDSLYHPNPAPPSGVPDFSCFEGQVRWVGPPGEFDEDHMGSPTFIAAQLQTTAFYHDWSALASEFPGANVTVVHVYGKEVIPDSTYSIQIFDQSCSPGLLVEANYSNPLPIDTVKWGDVVTPFGGSGQPSFSDIGAVVDKFKADPSAPIKARALLRNDVPPVDSSVNFSDIADVVSGFKTISIATQYSGPGTCEP